MKLHTISKSIVAARCVRFILAIFLLATSGCGYTLEGTKRPESIGNARTINISVFRDETNEPNLGFLMAQTTRDKFLNDGRLQIVNSSAADLVLNAVVREYRLDPIGFTSSDQAKRYRVVIKTAVRLRNLRTGRDILKQEIDTNSEFDVESSVTSSASNREATNTKAAEFFATELISLVLEGF